MNKSWKSRMQMPAEMAWLAPGSCRARAQFTPAFLVTHLVPISHSLVSMSFIFGLWRDTSSRAGVAELFRIHRVKC
jgi:hypothetical protein